MAGFQRVGFIFWLDGVMLEPGERVEYRGGPEDEWRPGKLGRYAVTLVFDDGSKVRVMDVPVGADLLRVEG